MKAAAGTDKGNMLKSAEQPKTRKGSESGEKGSDKTTETTRVKGPAPPVPMHAVAHVSARSKMATRQAALLCIL